jgi:hypothetical protein
MYIPVVIVSSITFEIMLASLITSLYVIPVVIGFSIFNWKSFVEVINRNELSMDEFHKKNNRPISTL